MGSFSEVPMTRRSSSTPSEAPEAPEELESVNRAHPPAVFSEAAEEEAEARELELSEMQLQLVEAKIRWAELEFEKEEYRGILPSPPFLSPYTRLPPRPPLVCSGRARQLSRQLDELGGGQLQVQPIPPHPQPHALSPTFTSHSPPRVFPPPRSPSPGGAALDAARGAAGAEPQRGRAAAQGQRGATN